MKSLGAILLAAGESKRLGFAKGLVEVAGEPWIAKQVHQMAQWGVGRLVVVVGGAHASNYADALSTACPDAFTLARNDALTIDPFGSLKLGIASVFELGGGIPRGVIVQPLDVPALPTREIRKLHQALWSARRPRVAVAAFAGRRGHPVLLEPELAKNMLTAPEHGPDARLDRQLASLASSEVCTVEISSSHVLCNLNTPEEWRHFLCSMPSSSMDLKSQPSAPNFSLAADPNAGLMQWLPRAHTPAGTRYS